MNKLISQDLEKAGRERGRKDAHASHRVPVVVVGLGMTGLGVVRSLYPHRIPLIAIDTFRRGGSTHTRLCRKVLVDPSEKDGLWDAIVRIGKAHESVRPVLILTTDLAVIEASERREELVKLYRFHLPDREQVRILMDKTAFAKYALQHGLSVPSTLTVRGSEDWTRVLDECPFPCVVKPKYRSDAWKRAGLPKAYRADSRGQLAELVPMLCSVESDYVIQEWVPGPDSEVYFHLAYYAGDARELVHFTGRKIRQWPPLIGSTSMAEGAISEEVDRDARRLMQLVGFKGLGSVEFKLDHRDRRFKIMEATVGRPNLQSEVATANGVNIAYWAYCDLVGEDLPTATPATRNVRWIFVKKDLKSALYYWRRKKLTLSGFVRSYRPSRYYADFSWRDPLPFLAMMLPVLRNLILRMLRPKGRTSLHAARVVDLTEVIMERRERRRVTHVHNSGASKLSNH